MFQRPSSLFQNRPYSTNDVVCNLRNEHGKAAVQKALDLLVADGKVKVRITKPRKGRPQRPRKLTPNLKV